MNTYSSTENTTQSIGPKGRIQGPSQEIQIEKHCGKKSRKESTVQKPTKDKIKNQKAFKEMSFVLNTLYPVFSFNFHKTIVTV